MRLPLPLHISLPGYAVAGGVAAVGGDVAAVAVGVVVVGDVAAMSPPTWKTTSRHHWHHCYAVASDGAYDEHGRDRCRGGYRCYDCFGDHAYDGDAALNDAYCAAVVVGVDGACYHQTPNQLPRPKT